MRSMVAVWIVTVWWWLTYSGNI